MSAAVAETHPPLSTALSSDGTILEGVSGSYDPTGFRMTNGPGGEPLFVPDAPCFRAPVLFPEGREGAQGYWYNHLGHEGMNNSVFAMDISDTGVL